MRVLLAGELGSSLGHLARLLPVAQRLMACGDIVLAAVRDLHAASAVYGPSGLACVQAPHLPYGLPFTHGAASYSDILLSQGWADPAALLALVRAWLNTFQLFRPDKIVLGHSPTAGLAARIARVPVLFIGNGFEQPPLDEPLPPFPYFPRATPEAATSSERWALQNANEILALFHAPRLGALRDLYAQDAVLLTTYPELDHYRARSDARYVGALISDLPNLANVDWPEGQGPKIFSCLRRDTPNVRELLDGLSSLTARLICVARGFPVGFKLEGKVHARVSARPVALSTLADADLCITYGAEGTMLQFLMAGTPLLTCPCDAEGFIGGRKIESAGLGATLKGNEKAVAIRDSISEMTSDGSLRVRAAAFASRAHTLATVEAADVIVGEIHSPHLARDRTAGVEGASHVA